MEGRVLLEPVHGAAERAGHRLAVQIDAVAGRRDLGERPGELARRAGQHAVGAVDRELAVVALAAPGEVLLAAGEDELVRAGVRPARGVDELRRLPGVEHLRVRGRAAVLGVDRDHGERPAGGEQDARADLADVVAVLLVHALGRELVDPVADHRRRLAVEDPARVDDRPGAPVEVLAVERALHGVVGDRDRAHLLDVRRVAHVEELHAAVRRQRRDALGHADRVEVARHRQHLAVGRHLLVLPGDVDLHRPQRLGRLRVEMS